MQLPIMWLFLGADLFSFRVYETGPALAATIGPTLIRLCSPCNNTAVSRPQAYDKWVNRMPREYAENLLGEDGTPYPLSPDDDRNRLATVKHYRSLVPMAQEARKPIFKLTAADGAPRKLAQRRRC